MINSSTLYMPEQTHHIYYTIEKNCNISLVRIGREITKINQKKNKIMDENLV